MSLLKKLSNTNKKHLKKLREKALQVDALKDKIAALSDEELRNKTFDYANAIRAKTTLAEQN